jgi:hypothetical protein
MAIELLHVGADKLLDRLDEKLFLDVFAPPIAKGGPWPRLRPPSRRRAGCGSRRGRDGPAHERADMDRVDLHARLKQVHCGAVAQHVGRDTSATKTRALLRGSANRGIQAIFHARA